MAFLEELQQLQTAAEGELQSIADADALETWRIKYLGTKGLVKDAMNRLKDVPAGEKPVAGKAANQLKAALQSAFDARSQDVSAGRKSKLPKVDVTLPGEAIRLGHQHVITQTINDLCEIFGRMGFDVAYGPEVEDERHNFESLNIPPSHPARDPLDNFFINEQAMLRSQTSTVQIRYMETHEPPVRMIAPGRVYRPDTVDATHYFMFHQVEGLYVDEGVTMSDLKTCLDQFCKAYFGHEVVTRFRPSFFPFTEPSAEVDLQFHKPDGSTFWVEMGGCGMVDPKVLEAVGYDPEKYTGYAFGLGIERMVMRRHKLTDLRHLFESDVRVLHQF